MTSPVPQSTALATLNAQQREDLKARLRNTRAGSTLNQYAKYWGAFEAWWRAQPGVSVNPLDARPEHVALYLDALAKRPGTAYSTITAHKAAISAAFELAGRMPPPSWDTLVKSVCKAIRRDLGVRARAPKAAATADIMLRLVQAIDGTEQRRTPRLATLRNRALLLVGFVGAFRRAALVALTVGDLKREPWGWAVTVRRDKTDQEAEGHTKAIPRGDDGPLDAAAALEAWLAAYAGQVAPGGRVPRATGPSIPFSALLPTDPLFPRLHKGARGSQYLEEANGAAVPLKPAAVADLIKRLAVQAGFDAATIQTLSGHSLRAGFVTEAFLRGADVSSIQAQTDHASIDMLLRYRRMVSPQLGNAAGLIVTPKVATDPLEDLDDATSETP